MLKGLPEQVRAERDLQREQDRRTDDRAEEVLVVLLADAVVEPLAVVVEDRDALVAQAAMAALLVAELEEREMAEWLGQICS